MKLRHLVSLALFMGVSSVARAEYYKLYAPHVVKGEGAIEAMNALTQDPNEDQNNYVNQIFGIEYSPTEYWKFELSLELEREPGRNQSEKVTNYKFENVFAPHEAGEQSLSYGVYFELEKAAEGEVYNIETKALLEKDFSADIVGLMNLGLSKEFGKDAQEGVFGALAMQVKCSQNEMFEPGLEYYASLGHLDKANAGEQGQQMGPIVQGEITEFLYDVGILFGVNEASPQVTYKVNLEMEF